MKASFFYIALALLLNACATENTTQLSRNPDEVMTSKHTWETIHPGGETMCSDSSPYSFHVKTGVQDKLFIFLNGGGACWNAQTCDERGGSNTFTPGAELPTNDPRTQQGIFDFENPNNPFADWSMLFVGNDNSFSPNRIIQYAIKYAIKYGS